MPILANVKENNPKILVKNRFNKTNFPKADPEARLGILVVRPDSILYGQPDLFLTHGKFDKMRMIQFFWGYRNHVLSDALSELPLCEVTKPANVHDSKLFIPLLEQAQEELSLNPKKVIGDSAHDALYIRQFVHYQLKAKAFIPPNPRGSLKEPKWLARSGDRVCIAGFQMQYWGKFQDRGRTRFKFVCPITHSKKFAEQHPSCPMHHPRFSSGKGCIVYSNRRGLGVPMLNPESADFKKVYRLRISSERIFSRFVNLPINRPPVKGLNAVSNLMSLVHISVLLLALTAVKDGRRDKMHRVRRLLREMSKSQ